MTQEELKKLTNRIIEKLSQPSAVETTYKKNKPAYTVEHREWMYNPNQLHVNRIIKEDFSQALASHDEEMLKFFDIELEAWMTAHENKDRSFSTQALVEHMRKAVSIAGIEQGAE